MTSKKRKYGDLSARQPPSEPSSLLDDVFAAFTGARPPENTVAQAESGASTTVDTPVTAPAITTAPTTVKHLTEVSESSRTTSPQFLDATHSGSEQRVYSVMYRETISKGATERHYGPKELCAKTGIRSDRTVRVAIWGLIEKLSIEVVSHHAYHPLGPRYRVYDPKEITRRRKAAGIEIDPQSKKIITPVGTTVSTTVDGTVETAVGGGGKKYSSTPAESTGLTPVTSTGVIKYRNNDRPSEGHAGALSSSNSDAADDDNAFLDSVRNTYERVTGNTWTTADAITAQAARDVGADVWGIAICYCVDRAPGHRFERLAYVLGQAREHAREMSDYSPGDLRVILKHALRTIERARASGSWEPSEADAGDSEGG